MKLTHWKCARCKRLKKLRTEIGRADMGALCFDCQTDISDFAGSDAMTLPGAGAFVYVRRRPHHTPGNHDRTKPQ